MDSANKVFESINDVSLNDILEFNSYVKMNEWEKKKYNNKNFFLHISELSFSMFVHGLRTDPIYHDKDFKDIPNTRYFMIIIPFDPEEYLKYRNMSVRILYESYYIDSQHHIHRSFYSFLYHFYQDEIFDKEFIKNLQNEIVKYLKDDQIEFDYIYSITKEEFVYYTHIDKEDTNNIEYYNLYFTDNRKLSDFGMSVRLINDNSKVTLLDVVTDYNK